jgi:hypothetical protein
MKEVLVLSLIKCRMLLVLLMGFMVMLLLNMPALRQLGYEVFQNLKSDLHVSINLDHAANTQPSTWFNAGPPP